LTAIAYPFGIFIFSLYYGAIHSGSILDGTYEGYLGLYAHLLIPVVGLVDTCISSRPWNIWHTW
jgi:hypothetical protein